MTDLAGEYWDFRRSLLKDYQHLQKHGPNHELLRFLVVEDQEFNLPEELKEEFQKRFSGEKEPFQLTVLINYHAELKRAVEETENLN